eukprot:TRINITY_DN58_c0_g1_i11.p1 TRINITY_DN58_c0_g1~~TRINITY_DN58_c0_g1_i11.p1  ORF type:complete len:1430 (+),score=280.14 TRINITY_DN58_c0_g1_i11:4710-8999(+)
MPRKTMSNICPFCGKNLSEKHLQSGKCKKIRDQLSAEDRERKMDVIRQVYNVNDELRLSKKKEKVTTIKPKKKEEFISEKVDMPTSSVANEEVIRSIVRDELDILLKGTNKQDTLTCPNNVRCRGIRGDGLLDEAQNAYKHLSKKISKVVDEDRRKHLMSMLKRAKDDTISKLNAVKKETEVKAKKIYKAIHAKISPAPAQTDVIDLTADVNVERTDMTAKTVLLYTTDVEVMEEQLKLFRNELGKSGVDVLNEILVNDSVKIDLTIGLNVEDSDSNRSLRYVTNRAFNVHSARDVDLTMLFDLCLGSAGETLVHKSGLRIINIAKVLLTYFHTKNSRGGAYEPLPKDFKHKGSVINVNTGTNEKDVTHIAKYKAQAHDMCFRLCVMVHEGVKNDTVSEKKRSCIESYWGKDGVKPCKYNFDGVNYPASQKDIDTFMKNNPGVSVNVYCEGGKDGKEMRCVLTRRYVHSGDVINLFYYNDHYVYIRNLNAFLGGSGDDHLICPNCSCTFWTLEKEKFDDHVSRCVVNDPIIASLGNEDTCFKNFKNIYMNPFVIVADFEGLTTPTVGGDRPKGSIQEHRLASWAFKVIVRDDIQPLLTDKEKQAIHSEHIYSSTSHDNNNEYHEFMLHDFTMRINEVRILISKVVDRLQHKYKDVENMVMSEGDRVNETNCMYCKEPLDSKSKKNKPVRDHCHLTGRFRGMACSKCNLKVKESKEIPVYFHNGRGYDFNFVMEALTKHAPNDIAIINNNTQKVMQITWKGEVLKLVFKDSCMMFNASLDTLIKNLPNEERKNINRLLDDEKLPNDMKALLMEKGVFPYTWFNDCKKLEHGDDEMKEHMDGDYADLIEKYGKGWAWYDVLNDDFVSEQDFKRAKKVYQGIGCNFKRYHDLYLGIDVAGLADVVVYNRKRMMEFYGLDFTKYISVPSFAWDALLKMTEATLPPLPDMDMYMFFEEKYGGFTCAMKRYVESQVEGKVTDKELLYIDANNLYGWAMSKNLPYSDFKWVDADGLESLNDVNFKDFYSQCKDRIKDMDDGLRLEVTLRYPQHLWDMHHDFPLAPYNRAVNESELTDYQKEMQSDFHLKAGNSKKLVADFHQRKMIVDLEYLFLLVEQGLEVVEIHRAVRFERKAWMKPFIDFNTSQRAKAKNDADKDLFKLMNNSVYGKTMENVRNRMKARVFGKNETDKIKKYQSKVNFALERLDIGESVILYMKPNRVWLNKPIYTGCTVLDFSKLHMGDFYYNKLIPHYGRENVEMVYTDTDSYVLEIRPSGCVNHERPMNLSESLMHKDFHLKYMDTSNYSKNHPMYSKQNEKQLGYFKNESPNDPIVKFCALKAKMYAYRTEKDEEHVKAKGLWRKQVKRHLHFDNLVECLNGTKPLTTMTGQSIRSVNHKIHTITQVKKALTAYDDKRMVFEGEAMTMPHGRTAVLEGV